MNQFLISARVKVDSCNKCDSSCSNYQPKFQIGPRIPGFNAPPTGMGKGAVVTPVVVPRDPETPGPRTPNPKTPQQQGQKSGTSPAAAAAAKVSRNLFGKKGGKGGDPAAK